MTINTRGHYTTTHARHFAQKSSYTTATQWDKHAEKHFFAAHEDVPPAEVGIQDVLVKITIPRCDRMSALRELDDYNINHFTLFQTEDALARSLGLRAIELRAT